MYTSDFLVLAIVATLLISSAQVDGTRRRKKYYLKPSGVFPAGEYMAVRKNDSCPERDFCGCPPPKKICSQKNHRVCKVTKDCPCPKICCQVRGKWKRFVCISCRDKYTTPAQQEEQHDLQHKPTVVIMPMRRGSDKQSTTAAYGTDQTTKKNATEKSSPKKAADEKVEEIVVSEKESEPAADESVSEPREIKVDKIIEKEVDTPADHN